MTTFHPELRFIARWLPRGLGTPAAVWLLRRLPVPSRKLPAGISVSVRELDGRGVAKLRIIAAARDARPRPVILWIHGGGFMLGSAKQDDLLCARLVQRTGATVVSVDYRLAPEHPFPAPLEDCFAAFELVHREASGLGVDPSRLVVAGQSAGGGLAAALALLIHDRGRPAPLLQLLAYPMLDDRTGRSDVDDRLHRLWNQSSNRHGWSAYLGALAGREDVPDHAAPARRRDLRGLPPAWIGVGTLDLFHDEDTDYAARLREAGVPVDFELVEGGFHAFDVVAPRAPVSMRFFEAQVAAIERALRGS